MRLRRKPDAEEILFHHPLVIDDVENSKGKWKDCFKNDQPIHVEFGMGKGTFITQMAKKNPHINYIGIERMATVLLGAAKKCDEYIPNLRFICANVQNIQEIFMEDEIDRVYLNFSDPWPKKRHFKRRLTYRDFLDMYAYILKPQGEIHFKTDNKGLYEFSLNELSDKHWQLKNITFDLHNSNFEGNIMTEYEEKFSSQGKPIYRCEAISPKNRL